MSDATRARNPFLLMVNPEEVLAAIEKSEPLNQLNRHQCRPLDRVTPSNPGGAAGADEGMDSAPVMQAA